LASHESTEYNLFIDEESNVAEKEPLATPISTPNFVN
jgi:hypothetical protein